MPRILIVLLFLLIFSNLLAAQQAQSPEQTPIAADPENKHIKVARFSLDAHEGVTLPKLSNESIAVCLRGELLSRASDKGASEVWADAPGNAAWNRSGTAYRIENGGDLPAEFVVIELKDSYAIDQVRVPHSERDPVSLNPRAIHVVLENEHVRLIRMQLGPRQGMLESQFPMRLEIALRAARMNRTDIFGKSVELEKKSGDVAWEKVDLISITNSGENLLDYLILELKHPFCYPTGFGFSMPREIDPSMEPYLRTVYEAVQKKWMKESPRAARHEERGIVELAMNIDRTGAPSDDDILLHNVFASEALVEVALATVRSAAPFPPLPAIWTKPQLEVRFVFQFGLPKISPGCAN